LALWTAIAPPKSTVKLNRQIPLALPKVFRGRELEPATRRWLEIDHRPRKKIQSPKGPNLEKS
jgi:hypothetical protein